MALSLFPFRPNNCSLYLPSPYTVREFDLLAAAPRANRERFDLTRLRQARRGGLNDHLESAGLPNTPGRESWSLSTGREGVSDLEPQYLLLQPLIFLRAP